MRAWLLVFVGLILIALVWDWRRSGRLEEEHKQKVAQVESQRPKDMIMYEPHHPGLSVKEGSLTSEMSDSYSQEMLTRCGEVYEVSYSSGPLPQPVKVLVQGVCRHAGNIPFVLRKWNGRRWDSTAVCGQNGGPIVVGVPVDLYTVRGTITEAGTYAGFMRILGRDKTPSFNSDQTAVAFAADSNHLTVVRPRSLATYRLPEGGKVTRRYEGPYPSVFQAKCDREDELPFSMLEMVSSRTWASDLGVGVSSSTASVLVCANGTQPSCEVVAPSGQALFTFPLSKGEDRAYAPIGVDSRGNALVLAGKWITPPALEGERIPGDFQEALIWRPAKGLERRKADVQDTSAWWRRLQGGTL